MKQSRTRVRTTIEQLVCTLFMWIKVQMLTPAMKKEALTGQQVKLKEHALALEKEMVDPDDPTSLHQAIADVEKAQAVHSQQVARVAAARLALTAVVEDYDYKELRGMLTSAGVKIGADPSLEADPDIVPFVKQAIQNQKEILSIEN